VTAPEPVRWGILSTARINELVLAGVRGFPRVRMLAVASRGPTRAEAYAREHGLERAYGSYDELLGDPDVEAVYVSLPNALHVEWTIRALRAGKHVLCEKPLTRSPEEAEQVFELAAQEARLAMEAFMWAHAPQIRRARELIEGGEIGELRLVRATHAFTADDPRDIRLLTELDGGSLMDVGCYCVHAARLFAGEPERVYAEPVRNEAGLDIRLAGTMVFPGGVVSHFDSGLDVPVREELELVGADASLFLPDPWHAASPRLELRRGDHIELVPVEAADPYGLELDNLSAAIRGKAEPLLGRGDAVAQARVLDALFRSADQHAAVSV
jgi:D-xylose 1-dehydrogenase (NADP+, D-xylono-1,5-lactone-forming)